ncbi:MAG: phosphoribosylformylglycinamidine cyclo-ligase [Acidimicrobiales bacterium]
MTDAYARAGVDIAAGERAVDRIRHLVRSTYRPEVRSDLGGFGGLFAFDPSRWRQPLLVSSTDSVGTKAMVASLAGRFDTIGIDLVAMSVDDIAVTGAEPLFFLDTLMVGKLDPDQVESLVAGVASGCRQAGAALVGGEMAELPGLMAPGHFDLVGFAVGVVEADNLVDGSRVVPGDVVIGIHSPGLRSNGFSLVRRVLLEEAGLALDGPAWPGASHSLADELLIPSVIYAPALVALTRSIPVHGLAHITGGGLPQNLARVLGSDNDAVISTGAWEVPRIFTEIAARGRLTSEEMLRVFNLGIGMVAVVDAADAAMVRGVIGSFGHESTVIGEVVAGSGRVQII